MARLRRDEHRALRASGIKLVQIWVPDRQAANRQAQSLVGAPEEEEALDFIERAAQWDEVAP